MNVYLDESGDLGWKFDQPFRNGGSSRYLTLAFLFVPYALKRHPRNVIKTMYKKYGWQKEKKAASATLNQKIEFSGMAVALLQKHSPIQVHVLTVKKANVQEHIREDSNKLYNYMTGLIIPEHVKSVSRATFIPDERTVKVASGNSLTDYLQIKLWFEKNLQTQIINQPAASDRNYNLQFADWIANCIWSKYEDGESKPFSILRSQIQADHLFF